MHKLSFKRHRFPPDIIRRWFLKFGSIIAANLRRTRPRSSDHWHLDEMVIVIRRKRTWLWRAVDNEGEVLDFLVQRRRDAKAAQEVRASHQPGWLPTSFGHTLWPSGL